MVGFVLYYLTLVHHAVSFLCDVKHCTTLSNDLDVGGTLRGDHVIMIDGNLTADCSSDITFKANNTIMNTAAEFIVQFISQGVRVKYKYVPNAIKGKREDVITPDVTFTGSPEFHLRINLRDDRSAGHGQILKIYYEGQQPTFAGIVSQERMGEIKDEGISLHDSQTVSATKPTCFTSLQISACPCVRPVITALTELNNGMITCTGTGIPNLTVTWYRNNTEISRHVTPLYSTDSDVINSTIGNVSVPDYDTLYTCTIANSQTNMSTSRHVTVIGSTSEEVKEDSKVLMVYVIALLAGSILLIALTCFGIIRLARYVSEKRSRSIVMESLNSTENTQNSTGKYTVSRSCDTVNRSRDTVNRSRDTVNRSRDTPRENGSEEDFSDDQNDAVSVIYAEPNRTKKPSLHPPPSAEEGVYNHLDSATMMTSRLNYPPRGTHKRCVTLGPPPPASVYQQTLLLNKTLPKL